MSRLVAIAAALALAACDHPRGSETASGAPVPAKWIDDSGLLAAGFGRVTFVAQDGKRLTALTYRASAFDPATGPVWFVLHGASRDAPRYVRTAAPVAERHAALAIVPHFTKEAYPKGSDYTLAVSSYAEIEHVFEAVRRSLRGRQQGYDLFGHSAGAQFAHRLMTFLPHARVRGAVAANAGWYTLPSDDDPRWNTMPYGLRGSSVAPKQLRGFFATPMVVLLGERDTTTSETDELVRGTPEAQAQGATRLERGRRYFRTAEAEAKEIDADFAWRLAVVPRAGHDAARVIESAGFFLFSPGEPPCTTSDASEAQGLAIGEILTDPARGSSGDANGDGRRDPSDDERIEIVNRGKAAACLSGWALGDAENPERYVFPLGRAVAPGGAVIVFGGGVPTGRFGDAEVGCSPSGLGLTNAGDVVTLRDRTDSIVRQVSWGNCAGTTCAPDHRQAVVEAAGSVVREAKR